MNTGDLPHFYVRNIPIYGDMILAPMDGISSLPFRELTRQLGSAMSYTEFINASDVIMNRSLFKNRVIYSEAERPVVFQIYDENPERILAAAEKLMAFSPDVLDLNMGCSAQSIANRGAGSGLLRDPEKIARIFRLLRGSLPIPITAKIRLGWDEASKNYLEVARIIEDNGGDLIAVHARTRSQNYQQAPEWEAIAEIKKAVSIPVIGNGNVVTTQDIATIKQITACDGVMIGRAAISNPWIFSNLDRHQVLPQTVKMTALTHLRRNVDFFGKERGVIEFRKFLKAYLKPYSLPAEILHSILLQKSHQEVERCIEEYIIVT